MLWVVHELDCVLELDHLLLDLVVLHDLSCI